MTESNSEEESREEPCLCRPFQTGETLQELLAVLACWVQGYDAGSLVETLNFGKRGSWGSISAQGRPSITWGTCGTGVGHTAPFAPAGILAS